MTASPKRKAPSLPGRRGALAALLDRVAPARGRELQRCATDADGHPVPRLRMLKSPLTIES